MPNPIFDYENGDFINPVNDNMGINSEGDYLIRLGENLCIDLETGELHIISGWTDEEE